MSYILTPITSAGATIDNYIGLGVYADLLTTSSGTVTLAANFVISPTVVASQAAAFSVRWNAVLVLSTFSVSICGFIMNQSDVNQSGTFSCYYDGSAWTVQYFPDATEQPQVYYGVQSVTAPTSGTLTLVAGVDKFYQRISGAPTALVAAYNVTAATAGVKDGTQFIVEIAGGITTGASLMIVFNQTILAADALSGGAFVIATFDATAGFWRSVYSQKSVSISQFPTIAALTVLANATNATAAPTAVAAASEGKVFMRRSNALAFNWLEMDNFNGSTELFTPITWIMTSLSAAILTSFTTPIPIVLPTDVGGVPVLLTLLVGMGSSGTAYATNTDIGIRYIGSADDIGSMTGILADGGSSSFTHQIILTPPASGASEWLEGIEFYTKTGNPTGGTKSINFAAFITKFPAP